jgi:uncharacterized membrane protein YeiH
MMHARAFLLPPFFDYSATFLWAISGAVLGARRGYAILGIITIALVSSTGGGLLRDGLFIQDGPPVLVRTPIYLWLIAAAVLIVMLFGGRVERLPGFAKGIVLIDALGLGAYAVVGMGRALAAGISLPGVVVVGMVNAVGGGILRDVLINAEPDMFKPGTLDQASALAGCLLFLGLTQALGLAQFWAAWITIAGVFGLRVLAIRFRIESRPLRDFRAYWGGAANGKDEG